MFLALISFSKFFEAELNSQNKYGFLYVTQPNVFFLLEEFTKTKKNE